MINSVLQYKQYDLLSKLITGAPFIGYHIYDFINCLLPYLTIFYFPASAFPPVAVALFIKTSASLEIASPCGSRE